MPIPRHRCLDISIGVVAVATTRNLPWEMRKVYSRIVSSRQILTGTSCRVASHLRTNGPARNQECSRENKAHPVALLTAYGKEKKQIIPRLTETCKNSWDVCKLIYRLCVCVCVCAVINCSKETTESYNKIHTFILTFNYQYINLFHNKDSVFYLIHERILEYIKSKQFTL